MTRTHRVSTTAALILCMLGSQLTIPLFASGEDTSSLIAPSAQAMTTVRGGPDKARPTLIGSAPALRISPDLFNRTPAESAGFAQRYPRYRGGGRNRIQHQEVVLGALASIAGGALLVYANRPECSVTDHAASGCSYGTKVIGGSVLTAGMFGVALGALTWR